MPQTRPHYFFKDFTTLGILWNEIFRRGESLNVYITLQKHFYIQQRICNFDSQAVINVDCAYSIVKSTVTCNIKTVQGYSIIYGTVHSNFLSLSYMHLLFMPWHFNALCILLQYNPKCCAWFPSLPDNSIAPSSSRQENGITYKNSKKVYSWVEFFGATYYSINDSLQENIRYLWKKHHLKLFFNPFVCHLFFNLI